MLYFAPDHLIVLIAPGSSCVGAAIPESRSRTHQVLAKGVLRAFAVVA
jgi:hypothetical protein